MSRSTLLAMFLALWALLQAASLLAPALTPPADMGFTRGLNRVTLFFQLQLAAAAVALPTGALSSRMGPAARRLGRLPGVVALLLALGVAAVIAWTALRKPPPAPAGTPPPVTAPAPGG